MIYGKRLTFEPLKELDSASITADYVAIGAPLANANRVLWVYNLTDVTLLFSTDGVTDHFRLSSTAFVLLDGTANRTNNEDAFWPAGMTVYVKEDGAAPTTGNVNVSTVYTSNFSYVGVTP